MPSLWQTATQGLLADYLAAGRVGLVSDMDGTLAHITPAKDEAQVTPINRGHLVALVQTLPLVAAVSGRAAADLHQRIGVDGVVCVGNHGLERWEAGQVVVSPQVTAFRGALEAVMGALELAPNMVLEDKGATLSVHYRQTSDPAAIAAEYKPRLDALAAEHGLACFAGKMVFEVRPPLQMNKGTALAALVDEYQLDSVLFLGDDVTDADAMKVAQHLRAEGRCLGVAVGVISEDMPQAVRDHADLLAEGVVGVEGLLAYLREAL